MHRHRRSTTGSADPVRPERRGPGGWMPRLDALRRTRKLGSPRDRAGAGQDGGPSPRRSAGTGPGSPESAGFGSGGRSATARADGGTVFARGGAPGGGPGAWPERASLGALDGRLTRHAGAMTAEGAGTPWGRCLDGQVALVTGASRGVGRGIAVELGHAGATVYLTGRSTPGRSTVGTLDGSVEETAHEVTMAGGTAIPIVTDHRDDGATERVLARIEREQRRLDLLVNNVWGGYEGLHAGRVREWRAPFWEQPSQLWDSMFDAGVRAHYVTSALAARLMVRRRRGLIVTLSFFAAPDANVSFRVAKLTDDRLAGEMAAELREYGVTSVGLYPGLVRTEGIMRVAGRIDLAGSESPRFAGRAITALAADDEVITRSGEILVAAELAAEYGFTDIDGHRPVSLRQPRPEPAPIAMHAS
jgi:NAD(P)-dependent dehydrogenase (short-subunit alcohol dehydrogenase family)